MIELSLAALEATVGERMGVREGSEKGEGEGSGDGGRQVGVQSGRAGGRGGSAVRAAGARCGVWQCECSADASAGVGLGGLDDCDSISNSICYENIKWCINRWWGFWNINWFR
jgi:hypothetical protein